VAVTTDSNTSIQALTVNHRGKRLGIRNTTVFPITLQNLFSEDQVKLFDNPNLKRYKTFSDDYLSVDNRGHLIISGRTADASVFLRYEIPDTNSSTLCAVGNGDQKSYLVSPFKSIKPISLNSTSCNDVDNFTNAVTIVNDLKEALTKLEYRFQLSSVLSSIPTSVVGEELKSLCCSFDEKCKPLRYSR
jgi:hypothetical protein